MKSLKISLVLFSMLIICIIINSLYIYHSAARLSEAACTITDEQSINELENFWKTNKQYIGLSISETQLDHISRLIISIKCNYRSQNDSELKKDIALLIDAAEDIRRYEKFSIENLF